MNAAARRSRSAIILALLAVYLIWGSTYLAILEAVQTIPPLLLGGARHLTAGIVMYLWARSRGEKPLSGAVWWFATATGVLMLAVGNGAVCWSEKLIPSGLAALLVATVSIWTVLVDAIRPGGRRPTLGTIAGVVIGFIGVAVLLGPRSVASADSINILGAIALIGASLSWAIGSIASANAAKQTAGSPLRFVAAQMLAGGAALFIAAGPFGEYSVFEPRQVTGSGWLSLLYLIVFGSLIAYTAYQWLLRHTTPAVATTYAYVNPVVAMTLGGLFAGEPFTARIALATALILGAVAMILMARTRAAARASRPAADLARDKTSAPAVPLRRV